jgi:hypothetical protein
LFHNPGDSDMTVNLANWDTLTLPYNTSIAVTGGSNDTLIATGSILRTGQTIALSGTLNTLLLEGAGPFGLSAPAVLSGIQTADLRGASAGQWQFVWLRDNLDLTLNVQDSANVEVWGAANNDTINLGAGRSFVTLGSAGETVNGGSGDDWFYVDASTIGATIAGGSGTNSLVVSRGGTMTMGAKITNIQYVYLDNAAESDFIANDTARLVVFAGGGSDTVTVGDASQTVFGPTGALTVNATAAVAGAKVVGGSGGARLNITNAGTVALNPGDSNLTVDLAAGDTLTLPTNPSIALLGAGDDTLITAWNGLQSYETIALGGDFNTLILNGPGTFDLRAPAKLTGIQAVDLRGAGVGQSQIVYLRNNLDLTLNVQDAANVTIYGAANNDIINLGSGASVVDLGSSGESVAGGSGDDTFEVTGATIGATIASGSGTNWLIVTGGGTAAMGDNITNVQNVYLSGGGYNFTANNMAGMTIVASSGGDTVTVGDASQTVIGPTYLLAYHPVVGLTTYRPPVFIPGSTLTVLATAANAGALIVPGTSTTTLDITTAGSVVLKSADGPLTLHLAQGDTLTLPVMPGIKVRGDGNDTLIAYGDGLQAGEDIQLSGTNTLLLDGTGSFNLKAPAALSGIKTVDVLDDIGGSAQTVWLRNGLDLTLNVQDADSITVVGAVDQDTINLGSGNGVVYLGSARETVIGGSGNDTFYVTAATIGATIDGGGGINSLDITGGGTLTMGANITDIQRVYLGNAPYVYFIANATPGLTVLAGSGNDTVVVGDASQAVQGSAGPLTVSATAAEAAVLVQGGSGGATLDITTAGTVVLNPGDSNVTVDLTAGDTLILPTNPSVAVTGGGNDTLIATSNVLRAGQTIDLIGNGNTLVLWGPGTFDLRKPAVFSGIQVVDLEGAGVGQSQIVYLRDGTARPVNVLGSGVITVLGAANNDIINLGNATAANVTLGGTGETVFGGIGTDTFNVTAATIGASITGGSGINIMNVNGGGTLAMGTNIAKVPNVFLNGTAAYDFTTNSTLNLAVHAGAGNDTIEVGATAGTIAATQEVFGSSGPLLVKATAADAGIAIAPGTGSATLEITNGGIARLNAIDTKLTVNLDATATLILDGLGVITANGSKNGADTIVAGGKNQTLVSIGGYDTLVSSAAGNDILIGSSINGDTFIGTTSELSTDTIRNYSGSDTIDITDMPVTAYEWHQFDATTDKLTIGNGTGTITLQLDGTHTNNDFTILNGGSNDTLVKIGPQPSPPTGSAVSDPHLVTFSGLAYDFYAWGEFTLAKSTIAGDSYDVQIRTKQYIDWDVSCITEVGISLGLDDVTFSQADISSQSVYVDGKAVQFTVGQTRFYAGGTITLTGAPSGSCYWTVAWKTGETLTINEYGWWIDAFTTLSPIDGPGSVKGLLGAYQGTAKDYQLADGTVLAQPLTTSELSSAFADAWRVTAATSLLRYDTGQTTATFTNKAFPSGTLTFDSLSAQQQALGLQVAIAAGITDPTLQKAAPLDYIVTGDPNVAAANYKVQQQQSGPVTDGNIRGGTVVRALSVSPDGVTLTETASGILQAGFTVYLTQAEAMATTVNWQVTVPDGSYLGESAFGGTLPSGSVTIAAGQTSASFSVAVPAGTLGALPTAALQVSITPAGGETVVGHTAQVTIVNNVAEPGTPPVPVIALLSGAATLTQDGNNYTLALGPISHGSYFGNLTFAIENLVAAGDLLGGSLAASASMGFTVTGSGAVLAITAGGSYTGLQVALDTTSDGAHSETITFTPLDQNASGYSSALAPITLTITDTIVPPPITLTRTPTTISGGGGDATLLAGSGVLYSGDNINLGGTGNTVILQGIGPYPIGKHLNIPSPGTFDLGAPTSLSGIQIVDLQGAATGTTQTSTCATGWT